MTEVKLLNRIQFSQSNFMNLARIQDCGLYTDGSKKYILFKVYNFCAQDIIKCTMKISQYDENDNLLQNEVVELNQVFKSEIKDFLKDLIDVNMMTKKVSFEFLTIDFTSLSYRDGNFYDRYSKIVEKEAKIPTGSIKRCVKNPYRKRTLIILAVILLASVLATCLLMLFCNYGIKDIFFSTDANHFNEIIETAKSLIEM